MTIKVQTNPSFLIILKAFYIHHTFLFESQYYLIMFKNYHQKNNVYGLPFTLKNVNYEYLTHNDVFENAQIYSKNITSRQ